MKEVATRASCLMLRPGNASANQSCKNTLLLIRLFETSFPELHNVCKE